MPLSSGRGHETLGMQQGVDRIRARESGVEPLPDRDKPAVVLAAAEGAGTVPRGEGGCLVEEEELGEAAGLHQRVAMPAAEGKPAGDPTLAVVTAPDPPAFIVQAAAVSVDEAAGGIRDQLAERSDAIL